MTKNKNHYLAHCICTNRRLEKSLEFFLNLYGVSDLVTLIQKMNLEVSLPIKLYGSTGNLIVEDKSGQWFILNLFITSIMVRKINSTYEISYLYDAHEFYIEKIIVEYDNTIMTSDSCSIRIESDLLIDKLIVIFDDTLEISPVALISLCAIIWEKATVGIHFDFSKIKEMLTDSAFIVPA